MDFLQPTWFTIALAMKTSTLFASIAVFGLLGLFTSGCSDESLSCTEVDAGPPDGAVSGGPDLAVGIDIASTVPDAPGPADAADGPASGGDSGAGDGAAGDGGLELDGGAGDGAGGSDTGGSAGPDAQVGVEAGGADSGATTDAGSTTNS